MANVAGPGTTLHPMLMEGEPLRRPASTSATNWQDAPFNRWAFWHVREVLPTHRVSRGDGPVRALPDHIADHDVLAVEVTRVDGSRATVADVLADTFTDAYAVLQDGALVAEAYHPTGGPHQTHAVLSITKSVVACVAGVLADRGLLDLSKDVVDYVPELAESGYAGATAQDLLDMRSGVRFREEYTNPDAEVRQLDRWIVGEPDAPTSRDAGSIRSSRRCARRLRTAAGSSTAPPRPTCSAGSVSGLEVDGWPT